jgi:hypothetical protein
MFSLLWLEHRRLIACIPALDVSFFGFIQLVPLLQTAHSPTLFGSFFGFIPPDVQLSLARTSAFDCSLPCVIPHVLRLYSARCSTSFGSNI